MNNLLVIENLLIRFAQKTVVDKLSFKITQGQCLGLVGESGSGKSLSALAIMQLLPVTASVDKKSAIYYHQENLLNYSEQQMRNVRGKKIGMIFQDAMSAFNPVLTIGQQINETILAHQPINRSLAKQRGMQLLEEVGIHEPKRVYKSYPHQLSGGMRQRAMIAMALSCEPDLLIADEPTTALDVTIQAQIISLLNKLKTTHNMTLLFISHDLAIVSQLADEIVVLKHGRCVEKASANDFFQTPQHEYSKALLAAIPNTAADITESDEKQHLLDIENLKVYFPVRGGLLRRIKSYVKAVDDINLQINAGETLALVGESGSGKTTTGKSILRLINSYAGKIIYNNKDITELSRRKMHPLRADMQIIFQDPYAALDPRMLIIDCLAEGLIAQKKVRSRKQAIPLIDTWLEKVELEPDCKWRYPHEFSGGQRQRICIARALVLEPKLLVLDEPTSALDVSIQMQILKLLVTLQNDLGLSYLLITHNLSIVRFMAHTAAVMYKGKIVEFGNTKQVLDNPQHNYTKQLLLSIPNIKQTSTITTNEDGQ